MSGRCAYAAYSYRYSPTPAHLSCSHHGHGGNRAHQPCLGEIFGSCLTFGLAGQASAPGQIDARELKCVLDILHNNL
ncbi:MAG: type I 3-dehydroquinate dehydratase [Clostridium sp.]